MLIATRSFLGGSANIGSQAGCCPDKENKPNLELVWQTRQTAREQVKRPDFFTNQNTWLLVCMCSEMKALASPRLNTA